MSEFLAEIVGVFVVLVVRLMTENALAVGLAVAAMLYALKNISGAYLNPITATTKFILNEKTGWQTIGYIAAHVIGGMLAYGFFIINRDKINYI